MILLGIGRAHPGLAQAFQVAAGVKAPSNTSTATTASTQVLGNIAADLSTKRKAAAQNPLLQQIQTAVTQALQNSANQSDADTTVQDAITQVLNSTISSEGTATAATQIAEAYSQFSSNTVAPSASTASSFQSFISALKSVGISPQSFHNDFLSAIQQSAQKSATGSSFLSKISLLGSKLFG